MTAINSMVKNNGGFIGGFREDIIRVIGGYSTRDIPTEYDEKIGTLQNKMLTLIEENTKLGALAEAFAEEYKSIINIVLF